MAAAAEAPALRPARGAAARGRPDARELPGPARPRHGCAGQGAAGGSWGRRPAESAVVAGRAVPCPLRSGQVARLEGAARPPAPGPPRVRGKCRRRRTRGATRLRCALGPAPGLSQGDPSRRGRACALALRLPWHWKGGPGGVLRQAPVRHTHTSPEGRTGSLGGGAEPGASCLLACRAAAPQARAASRPSWRAPVPSSPPWGEGGRWSGLGADSTLAALSRRCPCCSSSPQRGNPLPGRTPGGRWQDPGGGRGAQHQPLGKRRLPAAAAGRDSGLPRRSLRAAPPEPHHVTSRLRPGLVETPGNVVQDRPLGWKGGGQQWQCPVLCGGGGGTAWPCPSPC